MLICPACQHVWHAATLRDTDEWNDKQIALVVYCVACHREPPMKVQSNQIGLAL